MQKAHDASKNDYWRNQPSADSPINQDNLNRMETSIDVIDDRVVAFDTTKANQSDMLKAFKSVTYEPSTGTFTFTKFNNTTVVVNTDIEKLAINFNYDNDPASAHYQQLVIQLDDGTYKYVDLSALITQYEFVDSGRIAFTVDADGNISADIQDGSVTANKLQPNFLADCQQAKNAAEAASSYAANRSTAAATSATEAQGYSRDSEAWAKGTRNGEPVSQSDETYHNNAEYWASVAGAAAGGGVITFNGRTGAVDPQNDDYNIGQIAPASGATEGQVPIVDSNGRFVMGQGGHKIYANTSSNNTPSRDLLQQKNIIIPNNFRVTVDSQNDNVILSPWNVYTYTVTGNGSSQQLIYITIPDFVQQEGFILCVKFDNISLADWPVIRINDSISYALYKDANVRIPGNYVKSGDICVFCKATHGVFVNQLYMISHIKSDSAIQTDVIFGDNPENPTSYTEELSTYQDVLFKLYQAIDPYRLTPRSMIVKKRTQYSSTRHRSVETNPIYCIEQYYQITCNYYGAAAQWLKFSYVDGYGDTAYETFPTIYLCKNKTECYDLEYIGASKSPKTTEICNYAYRIIY